MNQNLFAYTDEFAKSAAKLLKDKVQSVVRFCHQSVLKINVMCLCAVLPKTVFLRFLKNANTIAKSDKSQQKTEQHVYAFAAGGVLLRCERAASRAAAAQCSGLRLAGIVLKQKAAKDNKINGNSNNDSDETSEKTRLADTKSSSAADAEINILFDDADNILRVAINETTLQCKESTSKLRLRTLSLVSDPLMADTSADETKILEALLERFVFAIRPDNGLVETAVRA